MAPLWLIWSLFSACLVLSFVLSGMEAGVFALSRLRLRQQARTGLRRARVLLGFLERPENFLWTIFVGNTLANFLILGWLVAVLHHAVHARLVLFLPLFILVVFLFHGLFDLLPKILFRAYPNRLCLRLAGPFRFVHEILSPLVWVVEWVSGRLLRRLGGRAFTGRLFGNREELRHVMAESSQVLSSEERYMIGRVMDLQTMTARQVMRPMAQTITVAARDPVGRALAVCRTTGFIRFPVWEERDGRRRVSGVFSVNSVLFLAGLDETRLVGEFVRPALFLPEDTRLETSLRQMQRGGQRMAIVLGPDRRETGILTLDDTLRVVFGEVSL